MISHLRLTGPDSALENIKWAMDEATDLRPGWSRSQTKSRAKQAALAALDSFPEWDRPTRFDQKAIIPLMEKALELGATIDEIKKLHEKIFPVSCIPDPQIESLGIENREEYRFAKNESRFKKEFTPIGASPGLWRSMLNALKMIPKKRV